MNKPKSICIFGDSTAWGAWDLEKGGWVNRLWFHVAKRNGDKVKLLKAILTSSIARSSLVLSQMTDTSSKKIKI